MFVCELVLVVATMVEYSLKHYSMNKYFLNYNLIAAKKILAN